MLYKSYKHTHTILHDIVNEEMFAHLYRVHQATAASNASSTTQSPSLRNNNSTTTTSTTNTTPNTTTNNTRTTRTGHFFPAPPVQHQQEGQPVSTDNVTWPMSDDMRRLALLPEHAILLFPPSVDEPGTGGTSARGELPVFSPRDSTRRVDERKSTQREWPVLQVYYSICEILLDMV